MKYTYINNKGNTRHEAGAAATCRRYLIFFANPDGIHPGMSTPTHDVT